MQMLRLKKIFIVFAVIASVLCLLAGVWLLTAVGFEHDENSSVYTALSFYFMGKAFFVGPLCPASVGNGQILKIC